MEYLTSIRLRRQLPQESYLCGLPPVRYLMEGGVLHFDTPVTFLVGENGSGKSTLLGGSPWPAASTPRAAPGISPFPPGHPLASGEYLTPARRRYPKDGFFLRAESFYNVATHIDELDETTPGPRLIDSYGGVSLHNQSHGESFLALVEHRFGGQGLYLLDEPEAALSPARLLTLMVMLDQLVKKESQFVIATHSPILMAFPGARIYQLGEAGVTMAEYRETEHYQLTRRFLENPERMLHYLLEG